MNKKKVKNLSVVVRYLLGHCYELWHTIGGEEILMMSDGDVRQYLGSGLWIHPCGKNYQEGYSGFNLSDNQHQCSCDLCVSLRYAVKKLLKEMDND